MGQVVDLHSRLGSIPIGGIRTDTLTGDEVPALLRGLRLIRCDEGTRSELFALLETQFRSRLPAGSLFATNDVGAYVALDLFCHDLGISVPEEGVNVIGFDNIRQSGWKGHDHVTVKLEIDERVRPRPVSFGTGEKALQQHCLSGAKPN